MHRRHRQPDMAQEAARVADEQLALALAELQGGAVDDARRHIWKVRTLMRVLRPLLDFEAGAEGNRRLRALNRRLAPVADAAAAPRTLSHLAARASGAGAATAIAANRHALAQRAKRTDRVVAVDRLLRRSEDVIAVERARIGTWQLRPHAIDAIAPDLEDSVRRTAKAMARAIEQPTAHRDLAWRRHATEWWLHVRLHDGCCRELRAVRRRLEAMAACLDESYNVRVLERILVAEGLEARGDTALVLRLLRHYQTDLRARATAHGRAALRARRGAARRVAGHRRTVRSAGIRPGPHARIVASPAASRRTV